MSRNTEPITKQKRKFNLLPESPAEDDRSRRRKSEYAIRLEEKQKLKFIYGVKEKQFRRYFGNARKHRGNTGYVLLQTLERRLDNVVFRLGFAKTRRGARQLVNHGHVLVNDEKVDIVSYNVGEGDVITLKDKAMDIPQVKEALEETKDSNLPNWLQRKGSVGMVKSLPAEDEIRDDIDTTLIIEFYSRG